MIQERLNISINKPIQHVETRWNSVFYMLERYLEQQEAIHTTLCILDRNDLNIPADKTSLLEDTVTMLRQFEQVTREVSGEKYVSASKIIPISKGLQQVVCATSSSLSEAPVVQMRSRFLGMEENIIIAAATLLDPRFKKLAFGDLSAAERATSRIVSEANIESSDRETFK